MKKMTLVDPRLLNQLQQQQPSKPIRNITVNSMNQMNETMKETLEDPTLSDTDKVQLYNQSLMRHNFVEDKVQPQPTSSTVLDETVEDDILDSVPKTMRQRAARLIRKIKSSSSIRWNDRGELIYKGNVYPNTNISDLVNDVLRRRKTFQPQGWDVFAEGLQDINVPMDLVGNEERWKWMHSSKPVDKASATPRDKASDKASGKASGKAKHRIPMLLATPKRLFQAKRVRSGPDSESEVFWDSLT